MAFSPDGTHIAYVATALVSQAVNNGYPTIGDHKLTTARPDGTGQQILTIAPVPFGEMPTVTAWTLATSP
jgi:hypothetical protein